ncbi:MAG TPA: DUF2892 domain-containing protein [Afifellaceae bacterium]|nr:DUF2892 domain-containing protein [Afifellaceae bacterium]
MTANVGMADRVVRIVVGLALIAFAIWGTVSWSWVGWIGLIPLITGVAARCPAYSIFGIDTCGAGDISHGKHAG